MAEGDDRETAKDPALGVRLSEGRAYGVCLWVGAGVSRHLTSNAQRPTPFWGEMVQQFEVQAEVAAPTVFQASFAERMQAVLRRVGRPRFQRMLRQQVLEPLADAIIDTQVAGAIEVPHAFRQISHLAQVASPIVNFNLETLSSLAIAGSGGPLKCMVFGPDRARGPLFGAGNPRRCIYHPHGAIDVSGVCALATEDYAELHGTLGLELAVHAAFGQVLWIVGMSMQDEYLKEQLVRFRSHIHRVIWFTDETEVDQHWAWANEVTVVRVEWQDFWRRCVEELPAPQEVELREAWSSLGKSASLMRQNPNSSANDVLRDVFGVEQYRMMEANWPTGMLHGEPSDGPLGLLVEDSVEARFEAFDAETRTRYGHSAYRWGNVWEEEV